ncbi:MAG: hypothetical protein AAFV95_17500 [Bacteroidota bacterium]
MTSTVFSFARITCLCACLLCLFAGPVNAQSDNVCVDNDCSEKVFSIDLDASTNPSPTELADGSRTEKFKKAHQQLEELRKVYTNGSAWKNEDERKNLGGKSCLRQFQLEGLVAHEYEQNPGFRQYIDQNVSDVLAFRKAGFESSRRALNLMSRMRSKCSRQIKKVEDSKGPSLKDLPAMYMKQGQALGYFDDKGRLIPQDALSNLNKQLNNVSNGLADAKNKLGNLKNKQGKLGSLLKGLFNKPKGLLGKLGDLGSLQSKLKNRLKNPLPKLDQLIKDRKNLEKKVSDLLNKPKALQDKLSGLDKQIDNLQKQLKQHTDNADKLKDKLKNAPNQKEELTQKLKELTQKLKELTDKKDDLLSNLSKLRGDQNGVSDQLKDLQDQLEQLTKTKDQLAQQTQDVSNQVDGKPQDAVEDAIADLEKKINDLKDEPKWQKEIDDCEKDHAEVKRKFNPLKGLQSKLKSKLGGLLGKSSGLFSRLGKVKDIHDQLKSIAGNASNAQQLLSQIDQLISDRQALSQRLDDLKAKQNNAQGKLDELKKRIANTQQKLDEKTTYLNNIKTELLSLIEQKSKVKDRLKQALEKAGTLKETAINFLGQYELFKSKSKCKDKEELKKEVDQLSEEHKELEQQLNENEQQVKEIEQQEQALEKDTRELTESLDNEEQKQADLQQQQEEIKEVFGKEIQLDPVPVKEWSKNYEVKRPYWDAVFHPDNEVVDGFVGKYFQVKLKDADKNVKLLFGPGKYYMEKSAFRDNYGSTIGAFVAEALHHISRLDEGRVKLFVQGSADMAGHKTFRGKLDSRYFYNEVTVLPQKADKESFKSQVSTKAIPTADFRNQHLPDLRGRYLQEMISVYSKNLQPIQLEGTVKQVTAEGERNAVIYLFIPEELLD